MLTTVEQSGEYIIQRLKGAIPSHMTGRYLVVGPRKQVWSECRTLAEARRVVSTLARAKETGR